MLALYGHPFSSYTWKAQISLHAAGLPYELRVVSPEHPEHVEFVNTHAGPLGTFPVLRDGEAVVFEATTIIEYLAHHHPADPPLIPDDPDAAIAVRMLDRVFDNYVMAPVQDVVNEHLLAPAAPDMTRIAAAREKLRKSYAWLEGWLHWHRPHPGLVSLVECAAAPALFYADWIEPIGADFPRLAAFRAYLLALPQVAPCIEAGRPFRAFFPPGAPNRD